jgi:uncharacterized lipoprotein YmbA
MMRRLNWAVLTAVGLLCACGSSPPTRFYTLSEIAPAATPGARAETSSPGNPVPVRVEPVAIPAELDRLELVHHTSPNQVQISDSDRWAAPLDEQIRRILSEDLAARLPSGMMADPNEPASGDPRRRLFIEIARFEANDSCAVSLHASWSLRASHADAGRSGVEHVDVPASTPCPASLPGSMSHALALLADRLAATIQSP